MSYNFGLPQATRAQAQGIRARHHPRIFCHLPNFFALLEVKNSLRFVSLHSCFIDYRFEHHFEYAMLFQDFYR